jgi:hypothetical protein
VLEMRGRCHHRGGCSNEGLCELRLRDRRGSSEGMVWIVGWVWDAFCVIGFHTDSSGRRG